MNEGSQHLEVSGWKYRNFLFREEKGKDIGHDK